MPHKPISHVGIGRKGCIVVITALNLHIHAFHANAQAQTKVGKQNKKVCTLRDS
jgi:hypothetical protein